MTDVLSLELNIQLRINKIERFYNLHSIIIWLKMSQNLIDWVTD